MIRRALKLASLVLLAVALSSTVTHHYTARAIGPPVILVMGAVDVPSVLDPNEPQDVVAASDAMKAHWLQVNNHTGAGEIVPGSADAHLLELVGELYRLVEVLAGEKFGGD